MTVWKLEADWGYPRGPHGKTRLHSNASRRAALHRYALTEADAEAMNLHKCSFAPAFALTVDEASFRALWEQLSYRWPNPTTGRRVRILDDRHVGNMAGGNSLLTHALSPSPGDALPAPAPGGASPDGTSAAAHHVTPGSEPEPARLALTGSEPLGMLALGLGALTAGVATLRSRRADDRAVPGEE